jgi:transcriptional regulator of acetoin/glycerol metabolism
MTTRQSAGRVSKQFTTEEKTRFDLHTLREKTALEAIDYCGGNLEDAAKLLGVDVRTLYRNWVQLWVNRKQKIAG